MGISSSQYNFTPDERQQIDQEIDNVLQSLFIEIRQNFNFYKLKKILHLASGRMNLDHGSIELGYKGCAGWMHKEGGKIKTWKYRFMRLNKNGTLKYYKKLEDEGEDQQKGSLSVIGYKIQKDPNQMREVMIKQLSHIFNIDPTTIQIPICAPEVFELYDETKRIWRMQPDSLDEKERWIKGIQNVQLYDRSMY
ncbi:MAG: hypothetical protein EZS28_031425 [Streblomastix strix]|uniref:PH domain-containing protein n=1 Tax=Streblomastix strix TaxID=222440 RepID=A0A5J4URM8_9EUKA|nr:MAG: hypothetical protein EZS28_031425 [Streblomastix strix]